MVHLPKAPHLRQDPHVEEVEELSLRRRWYFSLANRRTANRW